jgi:hypothetical protein
MIISIGTEKAFNIIQHHCIIKALRNLGIEGIYLHIILKEERLKPCPLKSQMRQGCPPSLLLFNIVLEFIGIAIRQEEIKGVQIGKEVVKLSLFADNIIFTLKT